MGRNQGRPARRRYNSGVCLTGPISVGLCAVGHKTYLQVRSHAVRLAGSHSSSNSQSRASAMFRATGSLTDVRLLLASDQTSIWEQCAACAMERCDMPDALIAPGLRMLNMRCRFFTGVPLVRR